MARVFASRSTMAYLTISAPDNTGFRYALCGRTGLGAGETAEVSQELTIAGRPCTAQGVEVRAAAQDCDALDCHNETLVFVLEDGTRIEFGARSDSTATYQD